MLVYGPLAHGLLTGAFDEDHEFVGVSPSAGRATLRAMWTARMTCSDAACPDEIEAQADDLRELEALACACGCAMAIIAWPDRAD